MNISIALCTYNGENFLSDQLKSIASQSTVPLELVICDDASKDSTVSFIQNYANESSFPIRIISNKVQIETVSNFSQAISLCTGDYIALSDQDDIWLPDKLEQSMKLMKEAENAKGKDVPLLVHTDLSVIDRSGKIIAPSFMKLRKLKILHSDPLKILLVQNFVTGCTVLINRPLANIALPVPEEAVMHDWWLALIAATKGKIIYEPEPTVLYRKHGKNVIGAKGYYSGENLNRLFDIKSLEKELAATIEQARALQTRLKHLPGKYDYPELDHYLKAAEHGGGKAAYIAFKYGIRKAGLLRSLIYYLLLLKGGYKHV